jgi:hypothetical protein
VPVLDHIRPGGRDAGKYGKFTGAVFPGDSTGCTENRMKGWTGSKDSFSTCSVLLLHDRNTTNKLVPREINPFRAGLKIMPFCSFAPFSNRQYQEGPLPSNFEGEIQDTLFDKRTSQFFTTLDRYPDTPLIHHIP